MFEKQHLSRAVNPRIEGRFWLSLIATLAVGFIESLMGWQ